MNKKVDNNIIYGHNQLNNINNFMDDLIYYFQNKKIMTTLL
jgi:hypothetical protein